MVNPPFSMAQQFNSIHHKPLGVAPVDQANHDFQGALLPERSLAGEFFARPPPRYGRSA